MKLPTLRGLLVVSTLGLITLGLAVKLRAGYESAEYRVIFKDGPIEIREYPDLLLVATESNMDSQGRDGSFMRLFRYISGANKSEQKIAMTTPVFMEGDIAGSKVQMGFVVPRDVAAKGAPDPVAAGVRLQERTGGRFAVIRFSGQLNKNLATEHEAKLREWMKLNNLEADGLPEAAGYDPPFMPARLRRNEVLIRLKSIESQSIGGGQSLAQPTGGKDE